MRQVTQADAPALAQLIRETGLDHNPDPERIARVSLESNHAMLVETAADDTLIGFVDAFSTASEHGECRWEVDLLGVHPDYQGRGIAQALVREVVRLGQDSGLTHARALVHVDNGASTKAFRRCGFSVDERICQLYVSFQDVNEGLFAPAEAYLIPVCTLTYSGVWIEGEPSPEALRCALAVRTRYSWDVAGIVIDAGDDIALQAGYDLVGNYRWLKLSL